MRIHNYPGFFVAIEGLDGCGGRTQVRLVTKALAQEKIKVFPTKEPTSGPVGKLIKDVLNGKHCLLSPAALQLLFAADRGCHLVSDIIPRLKKGELVITDRYAWSSIAYGSIDLNTEWLLNLNKNYILPDLTIFIEVNPEVCLERLAKEKRSLELFEEKEKLEMAWAAYHSLVTKYWWTYMVIVDGEQNRQQTTEAILARIKNHPKFKKTKK